MPDTVLIGEAFAAAAVVAALMALVFGWRSRASGRASAGAALAAAVGLFLGVALLGLTPRVPPREDVDRLLVILIPAAVAVEVLGAYWRLIGWLLRLGVAGGAVPVLLHGSSYLTDLAGPGSREWDADRQWLMFSSLAGGLILAWALLARLTPRTGGWAVPYALAMASVAAAVVVMKSGYLSGGQIGFPLGAAVAGAALGARVVGGRVAPVGAVGVGVVGLFALLVVGRYFAGLTATNATLLFAAPLLAWVPGVLPSTGRFLPRLQGALRLVLPAIPVAIALSLAHQKFVADSAGPSQGAREATTQDYESYSP